MPHTCYDEEDLNETYSRGRDDGYSEGYAEGERDHKGHALRALREKVAQMRMGASLPLPIYSDTVTLDELEQMIEE